MTLMKAQDHDDPEEGSNAQLTYSLQKNVIDETSGRAVFTVNRNTGQISTAICCLDRENAATYSIQVVATDGGGLQGKSEKYYFDFLKPLDFRI